MIIAIDPGPHTGIAVWMFPEVGDPPGTNVADFSFTTLDLREETEPHYKLYDYLSAHVFRTDTMVLEKFEYQKEKAQQRGHLNFDAAEYVGAIKLWWQLKSTTNRPKFVLQSPSQAVGNDPFWSDDKLKKLGLYQSTKSEHERSALRHLLYYVSFNVGDKRFILKLR